MSVSMIVLCVVLLFGFAAFMCTLEIRADTRRLRAAIAADVPHELQHQAGQMAKHAVEYGLPPEPWCQLAAFWGRITDLDR